METAKIVTTLMLILALFLLCLVQLYRPDAATRCHPSMCKGPIHQGYTRFADVERRCQSVLSSAAELKADADRDGNLMYQQLSFMNGDWSQDAGQAPCFRSRELCRSGGGGRLKHMDMAQRPGPRTALNASGILSLAIARNSSCPYDPGFEMESCPLPEFDLRPGIAKLQVLFQGVYTETRSPGRGDGGGGGERVLCMVGDAVLPVRSSNSTDPWDWANNRGGGSSNLEPPVVSDGNILLVLRYPKTPTLTTRAVHGVMTSTKARSDGAYFDTVRLVSQLSGRGYQFRQEDAELDAATCDEDDSPFHEGDAMKHHRLNRGGSPCDMIYQSIPNNQVMEVIPNWNCKGTNEFCSRLGPFVSTSRPATATTTNATEEDMAFTRSGIAVTGLQCKSTGGSIGGTAAARVAAVFRYVPQWEHQPMAAMRTGLSSMTLSAEGVWIPSTGRTHMVACLGVGKEACHYRVTLSVQTTVSMTRRGIVAGQITAMDGRSHPPLLFQKRVCRFAGYVTSRRRTSYIYTKVDQARELLGASEPTGFRDSFVAKSLLSYPSLDAGAANADIGSLSNLADELDLRNEFMGMPPPIVPEWIDGSFFELQILSAGTLVGRSYSPQVQRRSSMRIVELLKRVHGEERQQILNVSAEFMAYGNCLGPSPVMSLEGVYNAENGRMYLIGCRNVHAPRRRLLSMSKDLEEGMDCSIEVMVEYPPTTTRWLISRPAKVFMASTRDDDDPLHFNRTELHMLPVKYRQRRLDELIKPMVKGFLYMIVLLATIWAATRTSPRTRC
ncbi:unnamed protein product [Miscanthus lutarioriparius]|uniref:DUF2921 domain-containing protein n=1 Tax=Miscanthus lutarioriparius TaxID=422564 RepID=A0A811PXI6_9POAL|nr:unnamed protein product [Miscanthus lutarioriparius]